MIGNLSEVFPHVKTVSGCRDISQYLETADWLSLYRSRSVNHTRYYVWHALQNPGLNFRKVGLLRLGLVDEKAG